MHTEEILKSKAIEDFWKKKFSEELNNDIISQFEISKTQKGQHKKIEKVKASFPANVTGKIGTMCNNSEVLIFNFHLTVLSSLIFRYLLKEEIIIGSSRLNILNETAAEGLIFYRPKIEINKSFKENFGKIKQEVLDSNNYQDIDFNDFFNNYDLQQLGEFFKLALIIQDINNGNHLTNQFEILIKIEGDEISANFDANNFDSELVHFFLINYVTFLDNILNDPYCALGEHEFLSDKEKSLLLNEFQGKTKKLEYANIIDRFEAQVKKTPGKIALQQLEKKLTYSELNAGANRLAYFLLSKAELKKDNLVAILMDRSFEMVQSILSVWKCGAAYVPIDPAYPKDRIESILENSSCKLILSNSKVISLEIRQVMESFASVIYLNESIDKINEFSDQNLTVKIDPDSLSYVIYTSGSTGKPKGVMIEHIGMMNHIESKIDEMEIVSDAVVAQNAPQCFDISVWQFFAALMTGGKTVIYDNDHILSPADFIECIDSDAVTLLELVPSYLLEIMDILEEQKNNSFFLNLNILILNAETLMPALAQRWFNRFPSIRLVNTYGATEVSDDMSHFIMEVLPDTATVPVMKRPIQNFHLYIADENACLLPIGVKGEIYLSGFAVGRGYLNDPERTREAFIEDKFSGIAGVRAYRTGDIGRFMSNGTMEFYGRKDYQVKIRGHRVELGEIEHHLTKLDNIKNAVVLDRESKSDQQRYLVAYLLSDFPLDKSSINEALRNQLPDYMIPAYLMQLDSFPLTTNGKINKKILPDPEEGVQINNEYVAPGNEVERQLVQIWQDVLGKEKIGIRDNFFEVGGHSLKATKLVYKIHKELNVKLELRSVFTNFTIEQQALIISDEKKSIYKEIETLPPQSYYDLSHSQMRLWILSQFEGTSVVYNMHGSSIFEGPLDKKSFSAAFTTLIDRHESLRTVFTIINGQPKQKIQSKDEANFVVKEIDFSADPEAELKAREYAKDEASTPFDLTSGPLIRVSLIKLDPQKHVFLFTMHHIIGDGWSMSVLLKEVLALYEAYLNNNPNPLKPLRIQYKDYAAWQNEQLKGDELQHHRNYWLEQFNDEIPVLDLPTDRARPNVQTFNGDTLNFALDKELVRKLNVFCKEQEVTLFAALLSAVKIMFYKYTGQTDIIVGSPIAGREHIDLENQIGFYVNTLALRTKFSPEDSYESILKKVKENTLSAFEHQIYPFDHLVDELNLQRDLSRSALFDVMVALQNIENDNKTIPELKNIRLKEYESKRTVSTFDMVINFEGDEQEIFASIEYNTDLFKNDRIERMAMHLKIILKQLMENSSLSIKKLNYLSEEETKTILFDFNRTESPYSEKKSLVDLFEEQVELSPDNIAIVFEDKQLSYRELNEQVNRCSAYLKQLGIGKGNFVGIILDRSLDMITSVLAVIKSGAAYVPFEPAFPKSRIENIIEELKISCVLTHRIHRRQMDDILYTLPGLKNVIYIDESSEKLEAASPNRKAVEGLWDYISERATDRVTAAGFISAYTGEAFTEEEVTEYLNRITSLVKPHLSSDKVLAEIGVGSGLIMYELCNKVKKYIGIDPSNITQQKNKIRVEKEQLQNIELITGYADELEEKVREPLDVILISSTVQFFPDLTYLENVLEKCMHLLRKGGKLIIADVPDPMQRDIFQRSLEEFVKTNPDKKDQVKQDTTEELYVDKQWWEDYSAGKEEIDEIQYSYRTSGFNNELKYRYDIIISKSFNSVVKQTNRKKLQSTLFHMSDMPVSNPATVVSPDDLAYVIHTSGSTGIPKGVYVKHRKVVNLIEWVNKTFRVGENDRLLFITSLCFDLSVYDIFGILSSGGSIQIASGKDVKDPQRLFELICKEPITFWDSAPAALQLLVPYIEQNAEYASRSKMRLMFMSGDWVPVTLPDMLKTTFGAGKNIQVIALGGATEATVWSNYFEVKQQDPDWVSIPYGRPIQNAKYYILNEDLQPQAIGIPGDLYIGGECLAEGYINDEKLSSNKFIANPFAEGKIYKTGDTARWWENGIMEFLGRKDQQVKIRGYRIEMGEIESQLRNHPLINNAVVTDIKDHSGNKQLVAYYESGQLLNMRELSEYLLRKLPEYMVPSYFMKLDFIPLSSNGKVDKKSLPSPQESVSRHEIFDPSTNETEEALSVIWKEVLGLGKIGIYSNFFEMGGNSLKLVELYRRIDQQFPDSINVTSLFDNTSIAKQSDFIRQKLNKYSVKQEIEEIEL